MSIDPSGIAHQVALQLILDTLPHAVFWKDRECVFLGCNARFAADVGLSSPAEIIGKTDYDLPWTKADAAQFQRADRLVMEQGQSMFRLEDRFTIRDANSTTWIETTKVPLRDPKGAIIGVLGFYIDITERKQAEFALEESKHQLHELSTPLIPITDNIVILPLIGTVDQARVGQVLETLLTGIAQQRAELAVVDITGVPVIDTQVASALLMASHAVSLLGARMILTGIRPEVAQTLVGLGVDLHGLTTYSNLQQGIAMALAQEHAARNGR